MPGVPIKNLFLRDKDGKRHFLVVVRHDKNVDLKKLKGLLGVSKLSFASTDRLQNYLGVTPGAVTLLGLVNDKNHDVEIIFDWELAGQSLQCHPLINTATVVVSRDDTIKFLRATAHEYKLMDIPRR